MENQQGSIVPFSRGLVHPPWRLMVPSNVEIFCAREEKRFIYLYAQKGIYLAYLLELLPGSYSLIKPSAMVSAMIRDAVG